MYTANAVDVALYQHMVKNSFAILFLLSSLACQKQHIDGYAELIVSAKHNGQSVPGATIYLTYTAFTYMQKTDVTGLAHFDDLPPGAYFIVATGSEAHKMIKGQVTVILRKRYRQNVVNVEIALK